MLAPRVVYKDGILRVPTIRGIPSIHESVPTSAPAGKLKEIGPNHAVPLVDAAAVVDWCETYGVEQPGGLAQFAERLWRRELASAAQSTALDGPHRPVTGLVTTLLPAQRVVVDASATCHVNGLGGATGRRALIDADEPGLGKTVCSLAALRVTGAEAARAVIICPSSLTANWRAEMETHFAAGTFRPWFAEGRTPGTVPDDVDTVIVGWAVVDSWSATLTQWRPDALVADEGHYAKAGRQRIRTVTKMVTGEDGTAERDEFGNIRLADSDEVTSGSARATGVLSIADSIKDGLVMVLTGTPIVNRVAELWALLEVAGIGHLFGGKTPYQFRYCGPEEKYIGGGKGPRRDGYVTTFMGASNLLELNTRLSTSGHFIRRTKEMLVNADLMRPKYVDGVYAFDYEQRPKPWLIQPTLDEMSDYRAVVAEYESYFAERAIEFARTLRTGVASDAVHKKVAQVGASELKRIGRLRIEAATAKVPYIVEKVQELVDSGEKVVIAAHHRDVVDQYAAAFSGLKIQGGMTVAQVETTKKLFNETPVTEHPVLVLSVEAGKTGHTLCKQALAGVGPACAYMVFAEQVWTPGDESQAQDRIWRIGQDREVWIANAICAGTYDEDIYRARMAKRSAINAAVDAIPSEVAADDDERRGAGRIAVSLAVAGRAHHHG